jgi:hypothetical protein
MLLAGCATTGGDKAEMAGKAKPGFLEGYYEKLAPGEEEGAKLRWLKPGVDFSKYNAFMVDSDIFYLSDKSENKGIDGNEMKKLTDAFNLEVVKALKDRYSIVSEPGPNVARIRIAITDIEQSSPGVSAVTSVIPVGLGVSLVKKGATDAWAGSGETGVEIMVLETTTNEVIAVAKDERSAGFTERFSKWGSAEEAFKFWAGRIRTFFDNVHGAKQQS